MLANYFDIFFLKKKVNLCIKKGGIRAVACFLVGFCAFYLYFTPQPDEFVYAAPFFERLPSPSLPASAHIVVLQIDEKNTPHCTLAAFSWIKYAKAHNYMLHWVTQPREKYSAKIQKYVELENIFNKVPENTLVLLADCDIIVTNLKTRMETVWNASSKNSQTSLILSRDPAWKSHSKYIPINSGFLLFKNTYWSRALVSAVISHGPVTGHWRQGNLVDQPILTKILIEQKELLPSTAPREREHNGKYTSVVSNRVMNSFYRSFLFFDSNDVCWRKGDWVSHVSGDVWILKILGLARRNRIMRVKQMLRLIET